VTDSAPTRAIQHPIAWTLVALTVFWAAISVI